MYSIALKVAISKSTRSDLTKVAQWASQRFANVLIVGESGVGKEHLARLIHRFKGPEEQGFKVYRCNSPELDVEEIRELLFCERKWFSHRPSVTVFLKSVDGIGERNQLRLLEVLEDEKVDELLQKGGNSCKPRLICSAERTLGNQGATTGLRSSLAYLLDIIHVEIPPLRERKAEILPLANSFLLEHSAKYGKEYSRFSPIAQKLLIDYEWPGNVRELRHVIEQAVILNEGPVLDEVFPESGVSSENVSWSTNQVN